MTTMQVSKVLGVNEETVRRWIRSDKLKASELNSRKKGYWIRYEDLKIFVESRPKYKNRLEVYIKDRKAKFVSVMKRTIPTIHNVLAMQEMKKAMLIQVREES